jgi:FMN-dependent oxidoreductase (nitrilotriacetate monooxygenase family)
MNAPRQMKLGAFLRPPGHHVAAWRHAGAAEDAGVNIQHYVRLAQTAERGLFDLLFMADTVTVFEAEPDVLSLTSYVVWFEPFSLMSAIAMVTGHIGLVCTSTTTYDEPFHIARRFASLDQISGGRSGWNLVTSMQASEAKNFGRESHLAHAERYSRAREFALVVRGLWDSWDDDAFVRDKTSGVFFHPDKFHVLNHNGKYFNVRGPLNVARSPQGHPVMVQAGSSEDGKELAAETAEIVFTAHQTLKDAQLFYADVKSRVSKYGRSSDDVLVMPGMFVTVGRTEQEARDKYEQLQQLIHPKVGLMLLSTFLGFDLSSYPVDGPLPELPEAVLANSRAVLFQKLARSENLTIRQLYMRIAGGRGHRQVCGTPVQIADELESWFKSGAADGFNIMPPVEPASLHDFVELVIPELQRRGLFRTQYAGRTLRQNLGLERPPSRYSQTSA